MAVFTKLKKQEIEDFLKNFSIGNLISFEDKKPELPENLISLSLSKSPEIAFKVDAVAT